MKLPFLNRHEISYPNIIGAWQQPMWNMMFFLGYLYISPTSECLQMLREIYLREFNEIHFRIK